MKKFENLYILVQEEPLTGLYPPGVVFGLTVFSQLFKMLILSGSTDKK